jgi:hypothetical protein
VDRRHIIPLALLGVLTVLTALAAVWAVRSVPDVASQSVQLATAATFGDPLGSTVFSMDLTSSVSAGQGAGVISQTELIKYAGPGRLAVYKTKPSLTLVGRESRSAIAFSLAHYMAIVDGSTPWVGGGSRFTRTEPLMTFVARVQPSQTTKEAVRGKVLETATVRDGYLVDLQVNLVVPKQSLAGGRLTAGGLQREVFHLLTINGSPAPTTDS